MVENITALPVVKVLDFGIAKMFSSNNESLFLSLTKTGCIMGSPKYMAPEQICGEKLGVGTDIYAVGVVLFKMITGDPPFSGNKEKVLRTILRQQPPRLKKFCKTHRIPVKISHLLETIVDKALQKRPNRRFSSASEFSKALKLCQSGKLTFHQNFFQFLFFRKKRLYTFILLTLVVILLSITIRIGIYLVSRFNIFKVKQIENRISLLKKSKKLKYLLWYNWKYGNYKQCKKILYFSQYRDFYLNLLIEFFKEEETLQNIENLISNKKYKQALKLSVQKPTENLEIFFTRKERQKWLKEFFFKNLNLKK
jgi:serine/threonine protein kinase